MSKFLRISLALAVSVFLLMTTERTAQAAPTISNISVISSTVAQYDRFEATFDVATVATNLQWPYAASTPPGVPVGTGISVDGEFSNNGFTTVITQPAFLNQPATYSDRGQDHFTPVGGPKWTLRFTPKVAGSWQFRIRARDATGTTVSGNTAFTVSGQSANLNRRKGFIRVAQTDPRYFEFTGDGSPFIGAGFNSSFDEVADTDARLTTYAANKLNLLRVWIAGSGINGSQWTSWANAGSSGGYLPYESLAITNTFNGADVALLLDSNLTCVFSDFWQPKVSVEPSTAYSVSVRARTNSLTGGASAGFAVKIGGFLGSTCDDVGAGTVLVGPVLGSTGYTTYTASFTTGAGEYDFGYIFAVLQATTGGSAFVDEVKMWRASDANQVNLLREPNANAHLSFDQWSSAQWDKFIESAETRGVYLKLVIDEKNEWIRNRLAADGTMTTTASNTNFYGAPNTKVRFLMEAWWRYLIARWGYSTAIHSFEFVNEGNPYDGNHYEVTNALANYVHTVDPSRHMVSTSFWAAFPGNEFWANSVADYTDLHAYDSTGWGDDTSFLSGAWVETSPRNFRTGNGSARIDGTNNNSMQVVPNGLSIKGAGEWVVRYWMKASALTASCGFSTTGSQVRLNWSLDGGTFNGGRQGVIPPDPQGRDFVCASPAGTFGWTRYSSDKDRDGVAVSTSYRMVLTDTNWHKLSLSISNGSGTGGAAWMDDVEIAAPDGRTQMLNSFDLTPLRDDTTRYTSAYAEMHGGGSLVGPAKPYIRGESGIDVNFSFDPLLNTDANGVWLRNILWTGVGPAANTDMSWWGSELIDRTGGGTPLYGVYAPYRAFMEDLPVNNGNYRDANAFVSTPILRAFGQRDDINRRAHLWLQNSQNTWTRTINSLPVKAITGTVQLRGWPAGSYQATWWSTTTVTNQVFQTDTLTVSSNGVLTLVLPTTLTSDVAVKIQ